MDGARTAVAKLLREQSEWCRVLGSPLYAALLERAADDVEAGGPCLEVLRGRAGSAGTPGKALPLRFMAAAHRLALEGRAPELAAHYPSMGGDADAGAAWTALRRMMEEQRGPVRDLLQRRCQTNEVGRSAALVGGFLLVARETGLPLRILEVGASAGLNLRWDHYRYEAGDAAWGNPDSSVRFTDVFEGSPPPLDTRAEVADRAGCDLEPIDPASEEGRLTLMSHVWADQSHRFALLEGALQVAGRIPAVVERADAGAWLEDRLVSEPRGAATVVFHSIVMDQLEEHARARVRTAIEDAGRRATPDAPLAWLRMEHASSFALPKVTEPEVWLRTWPDGRDRLLATSGAHGRPVRWL